MKSHSCSIMVERTRSLIPWAISLSRLCCRLSSRMDCWYSFSLSVTRRSIPFMRPDKALVGAGKRNGPDAQAALTWARRREPLCPC